MVINLAKNELLGKKYYYQLMNMATLTGNLWKTMSNKKCKYKASAWFRITKTSSSSQGGVLDLEVEWKEFKVKDLFKVKPVKGKSITHYKEGEIPYITTSSVDNGLNNFIDTEDSISLKKCISIDPIGGKSFFHEYDFVGRGGAGSAINLLYNNALDEYSGLFICKMLESSSFSKASYGIQLNGDRLKNLKLLLPADKNGNLNWQYMSNFIKKLEKENIEKTLEHIYNSKES